MKFDTGLEAEGRTKKNKAETAAEEAELNAWKLRNLGISGDETLDIYGRKINCRCANIVNCTPHPVVIITDAGNITIPASGVLVRLAAKTVQADPIDGIATSRTVFGEPEGLPKFEDGTFLIVSQLVKSALPNRDDLLVPAEVVRDKDGNIIGCRSLGR